jgi:hypothetical protein
MRRFWTRKAADRAFAGFMFRTRPGDGRRAPTTLCSSCGQPMRVSGETGIPLTWMWKHAPTAPDEQGRWSCRSDIITVNGSPGVTFANLNGQRRVET